MTSKTELWNIFNDVKNAMDESEDETEIETENKQIEKQIEKQIDEDNTEIKCYNCGDDSLIFDDGIIVCEKCGVDNGAIIDHNQEWRYYGSEDNKNNDPTRCGMSINSLLPDSSMGTIILGRGYEKYKKLNSWNMMTYKERSLLRVFKYIQTKGTDKDISICVLDRTKVMFKTLNDNTLKRGKSKDGLIAACLYNSCKDKNDIRTTKEISKMFDIKIKKVTTGCKQFNEIMYYNDPNYVENIKTITYEDCIEKYCLLLNLSNENKDKILYAANMAYSLGLVSENVPQSIAVTAIYLVSQQYGLKITKKRLSEMCLISEVTISKTYKKLQKYIKFLLKKEDN